jgi:hypothetical protein
MVKNSRGSNGVHCDMIIAELVVIVEAQELV